MDFGDVMPHKSRTIYSRGLNSKNCSYDPQKEEVKYFTINRD